MKKFLAIVSLVLAILFMFVYGNLWTIGIQPEVSTELAMQQMVEPSIETSTSLRAMNMMQSGTFKFVPLFCWCVFCVGLYWTTIKNFVKGMFS